MGHIQCGANQRKKVWDMRKDLFMKREEAKQKLIDLGIAEPTEEQISSLLDSVTAETKAEKAKADKYKADADKAKELEQQLTDLQNQNLTDAEKQQRENEALQRQIAELTANNFKSEARAILAKSGLPDEDIETLLPGMIADTVENTQARANAYVSAMNKFKENAIKEYDKQNLDSTKTPGGDEKKPDETKTEAEKFAETFGKEAGEAAKASESIVGSYL